MLTDSVAGGTWSASNGHATVVAGGLVTGLAAGLDSIIYSVANFCGVTSTAAVITVYALPVPTIVMGPCVKYNGDLQYLSVAVKRLLYPGSHQRNLHSACQWRIRCGCYQWLCLRGAITGHTRLRCFRIFSFGCRGQHLCISQPYNRIFHPGLRHRKKGSMLL